MTILELENSKCTGCQLCYNICPVGAISMQENEEGYLHPIINNKCIDCGLCSDKCPQLRKSYNFVDGNICFAIQCEDQIRNSCSSGGVFKALADKTLKKGGVVCGAAFDETQNYLQHVMIEDKKNLDKILCSKYVQSDVGLIYKNVKDKLNKGTEVLFCGCPCQVDALKTYLNKDYDNLLSVDLLCHGVPSPLAYRCFLKDINPQNKKIKNVNFRSKDGGWGTLIKVDFSDGTFHYNRYNESYMRAFLSGLNMRMSCYTCPYSTTKRVGDITVGDFWGAKKEHNDGRGTSLVLTHNSKGVIALENMKKECRLYDFVNYDEIVDICKKTNGALINPTHYNDMRKCFFNHIKTDGFLNAVRYAEKALMDVGILGWWIYTSSSNYGSTLTAFALERYCASFGLSTAFISPPNFNRENAGSFNKKYKYRMTMQYAPEDMWKNNQYFKAYIVGSDVLWYYDAMVSSASYNFMLNFAGDKNRKISYATSFGNTKFFFPNNALPYGKSLLKRFDAVSTRENNGVKVLKEKFDIDATQVVDPVFLCDMQNWQELANNAERKTKGDYVFAYYLEPNKDKIMSFKKLADQLQCIQVCATDRQYKPELKAEMLKDSGYMNGMNIEEWIYHIMNAKYVLTDSFHGTCFSLIFRRNFIAIPNKERDTSRFDTLANIFGIEHCFNNAMHPINSFYDVDYTEIEPKINFHIERSKQWLKDALLVKE